MSYYDYGNARIHAMKSRLIPQQEFERLVKIDNLNGLIAELTKTAYRKPLETALTLTSGMPCITEALRQDLVNTLGGVRKFYQGRASEMVAIVLRTYDIYNLKAILRGLAKNVPASEILATLMPIGELSASTLAELARAPGSRACIDTLASMGLPFAQPLIRLRSERPGVETNEMELALDQWYFQGAFQAMQHAGREERALLQALQLDADLFNLNTVLRFAHAPVERKYLKDWFDTSEPQRLFVGPGRLPFATLEQAIEKDTIEAALDRLSETVYHSPLESGLRAFSHSAMLSEFEKALNRYRLEWCSQQIAADPLGIGVLIGYLALKINEVINIRWIAQAIQLGLKPADIRAEVVFVT